MTPLKQHETSPKHHRHIPETSVKHPETSPKQRKTKTDTSRRQDRDTTESMNFSILKLSPSTYGSQLHWFAQRCTMYKFKLEFWILLRNPIKMFINVHQKIKTPSPKEKKQHCNINETTPSHHPLIIKTSQHHQHTSPRFH